jgi:hypothetical protein
VDRRQFLSITGGGAAAAALAAWFGAGCRHNLQPGDPARGGPVRPSETGRPLLALLVPPPNSGGYERGSLVGAALNHAGDELLADLAAVELVCVTPDRLPESVRPTGETLPWFVLLERDGDAVRSREFRPDIAPETEHGLRFGEEWKKAEVEAAARVRAFADALHAFLLPSTGRPGDDMARRAAAARERYVRRPPPGAYWANSTSCGVDIEGIAPQYPSVACGMGMVPEVSRRFLDFYVKG